MSAKSVMCLAAPQAEDIQAGFSESEVSAARGSTTLNPGLSAAGQTVGHYEIASDGCSHERAEALVNREAAALLLKVLEEEKGTDEVLTELARHYCNSEALGNGEASPIASHEETVGMDARRRMRPARSRG